MNKDIAYLAIHVAVKAGMDILKIYNKPSSGFEVEMKADNSPLTIADKRSHEIICEELEKTGIPILSEEGQDIPYEERKKWKRFWLVDPIDGTKEFIKKNGEFTVNIALIKGGVPVFGVIYVPVLKQLYWGDIQTGAYKLSVDKLPLNLNSLLDEAQKLPILTEHKQYKVVGSRTFMNDETKGFIDELRKLHPNLSVVSKGSSLKICMVAEGVADIYPRFGPTMEWDTAAGHAIVQAAGKQIFQMGTQTPLSYNKKNLLNPYFIVK